MLKTGAPMFITCRIPTKGVPRVYLRSPVLYFGCYCRIVLCESFIPPCLTPPGLVLSPTLFRKTSSLTTSLSVPTLHVSFIPRRPLSLVNFPESVTRFSDLPVGDFPVHKESLRNWTVGRLLLHNPPRSLTGPGVNLKRTP